MAALAALTMVTTCCEVFMAPQRCILHHYWHKDSRETKRMVWESMFRDYDGYFEAQKMKLVLENQEMDFIEDKIGVSRVCRTLDIFRYAVESSSIASRRRGEERLTSAKKLLKFAQDAQDYTLALSIGYHAARVRNQNLDDIDPTFVI